MISPFTQRVLRTVGLGPLWLTAPAAQPHAAAQAAVLFIVLVWLRLTTPDRPPPAEAPRRAAAQPAPSARRLRFPRPAL